LPASFAPACLAINILDGRFSYTVADFHPIPAVIIFSYHYAIPGHSMEHDMSHLFPVAFGALQLGLVGAATYILCSAPLLQEALVFFAH
jgi:hypothetical protein